VSEHTLVDTLTDPGQFSNVHVNIRPFQQGVHSPTSHFQRSSTLALKYFWRNLDVKKFPGQCTPAMHRVLTWQTCWSTDLSTVLLKTMIIGRFHLRLPSHHVMMSPSLQLHVKGHGLLVRFAILLKPKYGSKPSMASDTMPFKLLATNNHPQTPLRGPYTLSNRMAF